MLNWDRKEETRGRIFAASFFSVGEIRHIIFVKMKKYPQRKELKIMDNKKRTLVVDTFDDLINMNGDVYDTQNTE